MTKRLLTFMTAMLLVAHLSAAVKVSQHAGVVTISVDGVAGQIGIKTEQWGTAQYAYTSAITAQDAALIKSATDLVITGHISAEDMATLVAQNAQNNQWALYSLDMSQATIASLPSTGGPWNTSFAFMPNTWSRIDVKALTLPVATDGKLPTDFKLCLTDRLERLVIPEGYTTIGDRSFAQRPNLSYVRLPHTLLAIGDEAFELTPKLTRLTLPNRLKTIGNKAFRQTGLTTMTFPASLTHIGQEAFVRTYLTDVYFLGRTAPVVAPNAFDEGSYRGNSGMIETSTSYPYGNTSVGLAERRNYIDGANIFAVMHLRADLTDAERANYTDLTRHYEVEKDYTNKYRAFYDLYYGEDFKWPGQYSYNRAYENAVAGKLWDGTTPYDAEKYMGLHKFTVVLSNVFHNDTEHWDFGTKGQNWWTICVPFNMSKAQIDEVFGEGTEVCELSEVIRNHTEKSISLNFKKDVYAMATQDTTTVIRAHVSYMIYPTKSATDQLRFSGYEIVSGSPIATNIVAQNIGTTSADSYTYRFIGNYTAKPGNGSYTPLKINRYSYYLGATKRDDTHRFYYTTTNTRHWNPYTATIIVFKGQYKSGEDDSFIMQAGARAVVSEFGHMSITGISTEHLSTSDTSLPKARGIYNISGQLIHPDATQLQSLEKGIYIIDGKKHIVK